MKYLLQTIILGLFIATAGNVSAQSCGKYIDKCDGYGDPYKYSGQSRAAKMEKGETSNFKIMTYSGFEYSVSLCAEKQLKGAYFRLTEADGGVLYDGSAEGDEMNWKQFYIENSKNLIIEVVIPESELDKEEEHYRDRVGCVAIIVEYRKVGKRGF